jgi:uncharacterized membrane protein YjgN (DUF898 family)
MSLKYESKLSTIYYIWFFNLILKILTLMIYTPWAKTRMRKYLYGSISIFGENLQYSGTGRELFKGSAKAIIFLFLLSLISSIAAAFLFIKGSFLESVISIILIAGLVYYAQYSALKYRLNRTRWCGIKSSLSGKSFNYLKFRFTRAIFNILTLGFLGGRVDLSAKKYVINNISTGTLKWNFEGDVNALDKINFITWILAIPTLGISRFWYIAALKNYCWQATKIGNISFVSDYKAGEIFNLYLGNLIILICSFGFGMPIIINRIVKFAVANLEIIGSLDDLQILQSSYHSSSTGDGLEGLVDNDSDLDLDWGIW